MLKTLVRKTRALYREAIGTAPVLRPISHNRKLMRLGSSYGGWTFADTPELRDSTIISAGLGEDASFDLAFAERYNARVVAVDPTPRAIAYFHTLDDRRLALCEKALWNEAAHLRFYAPPNPAHVSHSVVNFQNGYTTDTPFIEVDAITMCSLIATHGVPALLKLDIEGAEIEVICDMMNKGIRPTQMLVEYDELLAPSRKSRERIERAHSMLLACGYDLIHHDYPANFLYVLR